MFYSKLQLHKACPRDAGARVALIDGFKCAWYMRAAPSRLSGYIRSINFWACGRAINRVQGRIEQRRVLSPLAVCTALQMRGTGPLASS